MKFQPIAHSWVALHPKPRGAIQFIGGAFFGTFFPMFFYRSLLRGLFEDGYTIVVLPFNFTFDHYTEAGFLIKEQYEIMPELVRIAIAYGYDYSAYLSDRNFAWLGHSIGCKYIALLEAFSALPSIDNQQELKELIGRIVRETATKKDSPAKLDRKIDNIFDGLLSLTNDLKLKSKEAKALIADYVERSTNVKQLKGLVEISSLFIKNQPSLLLAPVNTGLDSAIPKPLATVLINLGINVNPTPEQTYALIKSGNLFKLLGIVAFKTDKIALSTCLWFENDFKKPPKNFQEYLIGGHLRPLGMQLANAVINFPDFGDNIPLVESIQKRDIKFQIPVSKLYQRLENR
ncbi:MULTISPECIES: DUF1350 family protein [Pseudanabaena]|uniref:DUF1350 domain-containing protein n=2 Tax=Pseudanabaena TaxID=1152 RepID=L8N7Y5_9CYAN|nr:MULTISPECIES: DUF1350 family protein [Pseudanabaena]ELS34760.1 protein of unknown function DUF1350 [Pseudanabaena biceps PCC 7429]MDG3492997.1 DUF1350 family protein [Pseudanabaena catenata USMAC16]